MQLFEHLDFNQARMKDSELSDADLGRVNADHPTLVDRPIISILVLDKEYVQGISTRGDKPDLLQEFQRRMKHARAGLTIVILNTDASEIGPALDFSDELGKNRKFSPKSPRMGQSVCADLPANTVVLSKSEILLYPLKDGIKTIKTMGNYMIDTVTRTISAAGGRAGSAGRREEINENWVQNSIAKVNDIRFEIESVCGCRAGDDDDFDWVLKLGRKIDGYGADGAPRFGKPFEEVFDEAQRHDSTAVKVSISTHVKENVFNNLILSLAEMNEWSEELAPIISKNLEAIMASCIDDEAYCWREPDAKNLPYMPWHPKSSRFKETAALKKRRTSKNSTPSALNQPLIGASIQ
ncbi:hypothetical protein OAN61_00960 [bacterium]|nr:hypothetical protein [bacterium]